MEITRAYKYRIYPTPEQEAILNRWQAHMRFLWNLALSQWHQYGLKPNKYWVNDLDEDNNPLYTKKGWHKGKYYYALLNDEQKLTVGRCGGRIIKNPDIDEKKAPLGPPGRKFITYNDQSREMTELINTEAPWLAEVNCCVRQQVLRDLADAWKRCFKGLTREPRYKKRTDTTRIYQSSREHWAVRNKLDKNGESIPNAHELHLLNGPAMRQFGPFRMKLDRPLPETGLGSISIVREASEWYAIFLQKEEIQDPVGDTTKPIVGIDRGVKLVLADSEGRTVENPRFQEKLQHQLAHAQRDLSRKLRLYQASAPQRAAETKARNAELKAKGEPIPPKHRPKNIAKAVAKVAKIQQKIARQRAWFIHQQSKHYAETAQVIVIEKLKITNMTKSAAGTVEEPGSNVVQKSGLNRSILDAGWGIFAEQLRYKSARTGAQVVEVLAAGSSQECSECGHTHAENRPDQATFRCMKCGHEENADINAAKVIQHRGVQRLEEDKIAPLPTKQKKSIKTNGRKRKQPVAEQPGSPPATMACGG